MYIAVTKRNGSRRYTLRISCKGKKGFESRDIMDLGPDPSRFIQYPGGNAFYFHESLEDSILNAEIDYDDDLLEDLFWPWLKPDIKQAIESFANRSNFRRSQKKLSKKEKETIFKSIHPFDKRRAHFLKFGNMDQGPLENMPSILFRDMLCMSRDEIEQQFIRQEFALKPRELKNYVYAIFNLQSFFAGFMAKKMPQTLNQERVDEHFIDQLCLLNNQLFDQHFAQSCLHSYLIRYVIMFFDYQYGGSVLLEELSDDFIFRHRHYHPPKPKEQVSAKKARE
ncbi:MAG: J domain-containing protein, partial [Desulfobacteraceae bacterium]|nr:J domain-containing protein [Desulfobacteraceae bacterium]